MKNKKGYGAPMVFFSQLGGWGILAIGMLMVFGLATMMDLSGNPLRVTLTTEADVNEQVTSPSCRPALIRILKQETGGLPNSRQIGANPNNAGVTSSIEAELNHHVMLQHVISDEDVAITKWKFIVNDEDTAVISLGELPSGEFLEKNTCTQRFLDIDGNIMEAMLILAK